MKSFGYTKYLGQTHTHYITRALDEFLIAEYPDKIISSLIHLTIGLEIFIKKELEIFDKRLVHNYFTNKKIYEELEQNEYIKDKKDFIKLHIINSISRKGKTVDFGKAIILFSSIQKIPNQVIKDLKFLKDIRNGVFHWGTELNAFKFSKLFIRIIEWFSVYTTKKHYKDSSSWEMGGVDPLHKKRNKLIELKKFFKNENAFNVQKRIFRCQEQYQEYYYIKARIDKEVILKPLKFINFCCSSCPSERLALYKNMLQCEVCDFAVSTEEYNDYSKSIGANLVFSDLFE